MQVNTRATLAGLAAILLWSTSVALARSISTQVGPLTAAALVYTFGGLALVAWETVVRPGALAAMLRLPRLYLFGCGGLFVFYTGAFFLALGLADDDGQSLALALVNYLWPALTIVFSLPIQRARAGWMLLPGTALALGGVFLVLTAGQSAAPCGLWSACLRNPPAFGFALGAAFAWALYSNLARRWAGAQASGAVPLFVLVSGLVLGAIRLVRPENAAWSGGLLVEASVMGLTVAVAYACWDKAMRLGDMLLVSACSYFTPLLSTLVSAAYLGVEPSAGLWLGCAALVAGSLASWRSVEAPRSAAG
jgi:drug/metabolite transporter (DMT)-like permease